MIRRHFHGANTTARRLLRAFTMISAQASAVIGICTSRPSVIGVATGPGSTVVT